MKKGAIIALLVLATSVGVYADGGKNKKKAKKEKAKTECCKKIKCSEEEKTKCCTVQPLCGTEKGK